MDYLRCKLLILLSVEACYPRSCGFDYILYIKLKWFLFDFVCLFVCILHKSTFLNRSEPNFAHVSPLVCRRS